MSHNIINIGEDTQLGEATHESQEEINDEDEPTSVRIDIALGTKRHRITLYADSDPEQLSAEFAKTNNLDAKLQSKLRD